jgi:predicted metal-dependent HD superfamily phosphohydrolase
MNAAEIRAALEPLPAGLVPDAPAPPVDELWQAIHDGYQRPPRHYHTFDHVVEVARWYHHVADEIGWQHPREVFLAVLFHDIVYQVGAPDNEQQSARRAADCASTYLLGAGIDTALVTALIELTARHGKLAPGDVGAEAALFLDCDMAVLGAAPAIYDRYEQDVAQEYLQVYPPALYSHGRKQFLTGLLARERIYLSPFFHALLDDAARANIRRALERGG